MTETFRITELAKARDEEIQARATFNAAKTPSAQRDAADELEFCAIKVAVLSNVPHKDIVATEYGPLRVGYRETLTS